MYTNLFLLSWPVHLASKKITEIAVFLQYLHYLANMAGLVIVLFTVPTSSPLVLPILAIGFLSGFLLVTLMPCT